MPLVGKVLWWDSRDGNGIIVDPWGNEFYFDDSVLTKPRKTPRATQYVLFEVNQAILGTPCACKVRLPESNRREFIKREFTKRAAETSL